MGIQRLVIDDFEEDDFRLIAIHCALPAFRLAYLLNKNLHTRLERQKRDLVFFGDASQYQWYGWHNSFEDTNWHLVSNRCKITKNELTQQQSLFQTDNYNEITTFLIPEKRKVDFFIKLDIQTKNIVGILANINEIEQVITAYEIQTDQLKSKNHLIF